MMNDKLTKLLIISSLSIGATSNLGTINNIKSKEEKSVDALNLITNKTVDEEQWEQNIKFILEDFIFSKSLIFNWTVNTFKKDFNISEQQKQPYNFSLTDAKYYYYKILNDVRRFIDSQLNIRWRVDLEVKKIKWRASNVDLTAVLISSFDLYVDRPLTSYLDVYLWSNKMQKHYLATGLSYNVGFNIIK